MTATYEPGTPMDLVDRTGPTVGGSEAPVIALGDVYGKTPAHLYLEKLGKGEAFEGNRFTRFGTLLEPYVRNWAERWFHQKIEIVPPWVPHPDQMRSFMRASLDGWTMPKNGDGGTVWEFKTTRNIDEWGTDPYDPDGVPKRVQIQGQHNAEVYDASRIIVVVLDAQQFADRFPPDETPDPRFLAGLCDMLDKRWFELWRDRPFIDDLVEAEHEFVQCVESETPPAVLDLDSVKALYPRSEAGTELAIDAETFDLILDLEARREEKRGATKDVKELEAKLGDVMRTVGTLTYGGEPVLTWHSDRGFDEELFAQENPALYAEYCHKFNAKAFGDDYAELRSRYLRPGLGRRSMRIPKRKKAE